MPADVVVAAEGPSAVGRAWHPRGSSLFVAADVRRVAGVFLATTASAGGLLVAIRRLAGGVTLGLSSSGMAAAVVVMLACVAASDWLTRRNGRPWLQNLTFTVLPRVGLWAGLWGVSGGNLSRGASMIALVGAVTALVPLRRVDWTQWLPQLGPFTRARPRVARPQPVGPRGSDTATRQPTLTAVPRDDAGFLQQQIRRRTTAGGESIRGTVVVSFQTGERLAVAHVGFCPPFQESPTVQLSTAYDEMDAVVTPGEVLPWGIRIECRLEEAAEDPFDIPVDFVATAAVSLTS